MNELIKKICITLGTVSLGFITLLGMFVLAKMVLPFENEAIMLTTVIFFVVAFMGVFMLVFEEF